MVAAASEHAATTSQASDAGPGRDAAESPSPSPSTQPEPNVTPAVSAPLALASASDSPATPTADAPPSSTVTSDTHASSAGQVPPSPPTQPAPPARGKTPSLRDNKSSTVPENENEKQPEPEPESEKAQESEKATASAHATPVSVPVPAGKRPRDGQSLSPSAGARASSSLTSVSARSLEESKARPPAKRPKRASLFARLTRLCCIGTQHTHPVDLDEGAHPADADACEKHANASREASDARGTQSSSSTAVHPPPLLPLAIPPPNTAALADADVIVPPTPTKQLLPLSETDGLTSGAVQPPGSTGDTPTHHPNPLVYEKRVHRGAGAEGEDSDSSFTEEEGGAHELVDVDEVEDEEARLIRVGGTGVPVGPDGVPRPLLPPIAPEHAGRKCLVLDLDETLVHSSLKAVPSPDYIVPVEIESYWHNFYVLKRPGVDEFLRRMGEVYEVVVFTASLSKYADPVLDRLDPYRSVAHRLFRESCYNHKGNYVKDLSQLGRPVKDTIILDNSPASYIFHPHNAVPVSSWFNDPHDTELTDLCPFLADLTGVEDVRGVLNPGI